MLRKSQWRIGFGLCIQLAAVSMPAWAATIVVPDDMGLQAALTATGNHDIILIRAGTYPGPFSFAGKDLTITGESGAAATILDGQNLDRVMDVGAGVTTDTEIIGITFDRGRAENGANIQLADGSGLTLTSCVIRNATGPAMAIGGVAVGTGSSLVLDDCEFRNNVMGLGGGL